MSIQIVDSSATSNRRLNSRSLVGSRAGGEWTRPSEWPALPTITASDEKFAGVFAVFNTDGNYVALSATGSYTVDWGDGTIENYSSGAVAEHQYAYSNSSLTPTAYGYKCAVVVVEPQPNQHLTGLNINKRHSVLTQTITSKWLDIALSLPNSTSSGITFSGNTSHTRHRNLQRSQILNIGGCTNLSYLFQHCNSLRSVFLCSTSSVKDMSYMFTNCHSLQSVPFFSCASATSWAYIFQYCYSLLSIPAFNTSSITNFSYAFFQAVALQSLPSLDMSGAASGCGYSFAVSASSLSSSSCTGMKYSTDYSNCSFSKTGLETIFTNLGKAADTSQAITITSNYGADTAVSKASCTTTAGSSTVALADTSNLVTGMICTGTGISTGVACTFQDSGDTVTLAGHGLANGTMISFSAITSTTGIATYTNYWVVNATADTFQVASTQGGNALALTTNGSGTLLYPAYVVTINTNTSVVLSAPASANGTVTLSFRKLDTFKATSKGWTITG